MENKTLTPFTNHSSLSMEGVMNRDWSDMEIDPEKFKKADPALFERPLITPVITLPASQEKPREKTHE